MRLCHIHHSQRSHTTTINASVMRGEVSEMMICSSKHTMQPTKTQKENTTFIILLRM
jgi:tRNA-binding EMAP/Myf-like protein